MPRSFAHQVDHQRRLLAAVQLEHGWGHSEGEHVERCVKSRATTILTIVLRPEQSEATGTTRVANAPLPARGVPEEAAAAIELGRYIQDGLVPHGKERNRERSALGRDGDLVFILPHAVGDEADRQGAR
eukprot:scaffold1355_cov268-Pinguiococcus_pyrenoidosus.AAC.77